MLSAVNWTEVCPSAFVVALSGERLASLVVSTPARFTMSVQSTGMPDARTGFFEESSICEMSVCTSPIAGLRFWK